MPLANISGLASGIDTAALISQLMAVEANPQTLLKQKLSAQQQTVTALQALNAKLASLATRTGDLSKATNWSPLTATSSSEKVAVNAGPAATPGSLSFTVTATASTHQLSFTQTAAGDARVTGPDSTFVRVTKSDGTTLDIDSGDGTMGGLVRALNNDADAGVRASTVKLDDGTLRLRVESRSTGQASSFTLTNADGSELLGGPRTDATVVGRDAAIKVGPDTIHSSTNTFTGVFAGIDLTVAADVELDEPVTITVARDTGAITESVKSMVDALNAIIADIDKQAGVDASGKGGLLTGDSTVRALRNQLLSTVTSASDGSSLADVGIQLDRYGKITFDEEKFATAYAANPEAVTTKFTSGDVEGFAGRLATVTDKASDSIDGTITNTIKSRNSTVDDMEKAIEDWDVRLALREQTLTRQFTAMEVALQSLQSQSSWLASQINSLPKIDSGK